MTNPKFIILDQSLKTGEGHHHELAHMLTHPARELSLEVIWLTHADFKLDLDSAGAKVVPHFQASMYDQYTKDKKNVPTAPFSEQILDGLKKCGATPQDYVLMHTGDGVLYRALDEILTKNDYRELPQFHICTPYDLGIMPGKTPDIPLENTFAALRQHDALNRSLFFWAEIARLARQMTDTLGIETHALDIPQPIRPYHRGKNGPLTLVYMGAAREEKGFHLLPDVIEAVAKRTKPGQVFFDLQASPQIIGYLPIIKKAIARLEQFPADLVNLRRENQSQEAYKKMLTECDGVLALYLYNNYRMRGSGIAVEAISNGKALITTTGTFPASLVSHGGGVIGANTQEWADGIVDMVNNREKYMANAATQRLECASRNSPTLYIQRILDRKDNARQLLSSPLCHLQAEYQMLVTGQGHPTSLP